jgi:hypothetical protein
MSRKPEKLTQAKIIAKTMQLPINECRIGWDCIRYGKRSDKECNGCHWWYPLNKTNKK